MTPAADTRSRDHVFLTRFNMPSPGVESLIRAQPGWLERRVDLFETYCLPSLHAQTERNFHWIVYFDRESPLWLKDRIGSWQLQVPMHAFFRISISDAERIADIKAVVAEPADELLTTNIDNDDGLATDFVERLAGCQRLHERCAVYFEYGLIVSDARVYLQRDRTNAFCSVLETWDRPVTCWAAAHNDLARLMPQVTIAGAPAWLQVIHDTNVSNRTEGRRVSARSHLEQFPKLEAIAEPNHLELALDRLVGVPMRLAHRLVRKTAKATIIGLSGREGGEKVKYVLRQIRRTLGAVVK